MGLSRMLCVPKNLDPHVMVMKSAKDRARADHSSSLNGTKDRRIFIQ